MSSSGARADQSGARNRSRRRLQTDTSPLVRCATLQPSEVSRMKRVVEATVVLFTLFVGVGFVGCAAPIDFATSDWPLNDAVLEAEYMEFASNVGEAYVEGGAS